MSDNWFLCILIVISEEYFEFFLKMQLIQTWRIIKELGIKYKRPKLALKHERDYEEKKKVVDNYKKVSSALLKNNGSFRI
jgi:hypothetical protein